MGILRTREEYLPVTCAILKNEDREAFFGAIKKQQGSRPEQLARLCEVQVDLVNEWIAGKANVPYHTLQMLAHQFQVPLPPVGELRREYMAVSQVASRREPPPLPPAPKRERKAKREAREPREPRQAREPRGERKPRRQRKERPARTPKPQAEGRAHAQPKKAKGQPRVPKGPRVPEPSEELSYWAGISLLAAKRQEGALVMAADRRIGQNFAATWANLTRDLFGVKPALRMLDNGKVQEASLPAAGFEEFLDRMGFPVSGETSAPAVPRWAWSTAGWKSACLKGVVDACAHFQRQPALVLHKLPERIAKAAEKMLSSLGFKPEVAADGTVALRGAEEVTRYFETVGTGNMKLRDQFRAFQHPRRGGRPAGPEAPAGAAGEDAHADRGAVEHERMLADEVEAADEEAEITAEALDAEPSSQEEASRSEAAPAPEAAPASKPAPRRRRTLFRGRPNH